MSTVDALSSTGSSSKAGTGFSGLSSEDFTKIVLTELSKQDPLQPNDTNALLQQLSTIRSIQSDTDLSDSLKSLTRQNDFAAAATLIGKNVSGIDQYGARVVGTVESVGRTSTASLVKLKTGEVMDFTNVDRIDAPRTTTTTGTTGTAGASNG
jgi:flagellar basal-body rod modification protein FlgD